MTILVFPEAIETRRLLLRPYNRNDWAGILELIGRNREQLIRDFEQQARLQQLAEGKAFIAEKQKHWKDGREFCYGIWLRSSREQVGQIRVKNIDWKVPSAELSYFIDGQNQRRGYASESIRQVLKLVFGLGFRRVFVRVLPANRESLALAIKLHFREEGYHRLEFRCGHGELHDVHYLAMTQADFRLVRPVSQPSPAKSTRQHSS